MGGRPTGPQRLLTRIRRSLLIMTVLTVAVAAVTADLALGGVLLEVDRAIGTIEFRAMWPEAVPIAGWLDRIGTRAVALPLLFLLTVVIWRRTGAAAPFVIAVLSNLGLNLVVGVLKITTMRESPRDGGPEFFVGDLLYPSGHSGNVVLIYGLMAAFALRYGIVRQHRRRILSTGVVALTAAMFAISVYRETHWLTDLAVGAMIGGIMLEGSLMVDREWAVVSDLARRVAWPVLRRFAAARARLGPPAADGDRVADERRDPVPVGAPSGGDTGARSGDGSRTDAPVSRSAREQATSRG